MSIEMIAGADVRLTHVSSGSSAFGTTDSLGEVELACDDYSDWSVAITKTGFTGATATLAVSGATAQTYRLTANDSATPSAPGTATGSILVLGCDGLPAMGVDDSTQYVSGGSLEGVSPCREPVTVQTDRDGIAEFTG